MKHIVQQVAMKALIVNDEGKVLILRDASAYGESAQRGRYDLPGGRVERGEPPDLALHREVMEETGLEIEIGQPIYVGEWRPIIKGVPHQIIGTFIVCKPKRLRPITLSIEHDDYKWIQPDEYHQHPILSPADKAIARLSKWQKSAPPPLSL
jgi:8-oxo-dGTP diphosphatase